MESNYSKIISNFIKTKIGLENFLLHENEEEIVASFTSSFSRFNLPISIVTINIKFNIIKIYDLFEKFDLNSFEEIIRNDIVSLFYLILQKNDVKYVAHDFIDGLTQINFIIVSLPLLTSTNPKIEEIYKYKIDGYLNLVPELHRLKNSIMLSGYILKSKAKINSGLITTKICNNQKCINKEISLITEQFNLKVEINTKSIIKLNLNEGNTNCSACGSNLTKIFDELSLEYEFILAYNNSYLQIKVNRQLYEMIMNSKDENFNVVGYLERDKTGKIYLKSQNIFITTRFSLVDKYLAHKLQSSIGDNIEERLKNSAESILPFKKSIESIDIMIMIIGNFFNIIYDINDRENTIPILKKAKDSLSSTTSDDNSFYSDMLTRNGSNKEKGEMICENSFLSLRSTLHTPYSEFDNDKSPETNNLKILIATNDINYVKNILKAVTKTKIIYSTKKLKDFMPEKCIILVDFFHNIHPDARNSISSVFNLKIDETSFHDYSYEKRIFGHLQEREIKLSSKNTTEIKCLFIEERKFTSNEMAPLKLLRTIMLLYGSILYFGVEKDIKKYIKKYFLKQNVIQ